MISVETRNRLMDIPGGSIIELIVDLPALIKLMIWLSPEVFHFATNYIFDRRR